MESVGHLGWASRGGGAASRCLAHSLLQGEQLLVPGDLAALTEKLARLSGLSSQAGGWVE